MVQYSDFPSQTPLVRPKSAIFIPKRDHEHPRHFYMGVPQGGFPPAGSTRIFLSGSPVSLNEKSSFSSLSKVETLTFPTQKTESLLYTT